MVIIIMGVSGSGKSTIGSNLAEKLHLPYFDADDYHPIENVKKMSSGKPLNDDDRQPWLEILSDKIAEWNQTGGAVLACSALKESYRSILQSKSKNIQFVYLKGDRDLILDRMKKRSGHYMPPELLDSQFDALEEPENTIKVSIEPSPEEIVERIVSKLKTID